MARSKKYLSEQEKLDQVYRIEIDHLRKKTIIINVFLAIIAIPMMVALYFFDVDFLKMFVYVFTFAFIIAMNFIFYFYKHLLPDIKLSMYITTFGLYLITISVILDIATPSIFTMLFLSYGIIAIYQDMKVSITNNLLLLFSGSLLVTQFPEIFEIAQALSPSTFYIMVFLIIFVALLSISSFIIIQRKMHFYHQVVNIKEEEYKYIDTIFEIQKQYSQRQFDYESYYENLETFTHELSEQIGIENVFKERLDLIKDLALYSDDEILEKYPEYSKADIEELKQLELSDYKKIAYVAFKAAQIKDIQPEKKELLFETQTPSLDHRSDSLEVKIIAFAVFYTMLRLNKITTYPLSTSQIAAILDTESFKRKINGYILSIYKNHQDSIEEIVDELAERSVVG